MTTARITIGAPALPEKLRIAYQALTAAGFEVLGVDFSQTPEEIVITAVTHQEGSRARRSSSAA